MKDALLYIVKSIASDPDSIQVDENEEDGTVHFTLHVAKEDMGKIIGKEGRVIRSIRNVMKIPAKKQDKRVEITLSENQ